MQQPAAYAVFCAVSFTTVMHNIVTNAKNPDPDTRLKHLGQFNLNLDFSRTV